MAAEELVKLRSSDGKLFEVAEEVAFESEIIKTLVEEVGKSAPFPLEHVSSKILSKVIEYCEFVQTSKQKSKDEIKAWEAEFLRTDRATLFEITHAANYMHIQRLLDFCCVEVAYMMKSKTIEEIRKAFYIIPAFTPEEDEKMRRENPWAFEKAIERKKP